MFPSVRGSRNVVSYAEHIKNAWMVDKIKTTNFIIYLLVNRSPLLIECMSWLLENDIESFEFMLEIMYSMKKWKIFFDILFEFRSKEVKDERVTKMNLKMMPILSRRISKDVIKKSKGMRISSISDFLPKERSKYDNDTHFIQNFMSVFSTNEGKKREIYRKTIYPLKKYANRTSRWEKKDRLKHLNGKDIQRSKYIGELYNIGANTETLLPHEIVKEYVDTPYEKSYKNVNIGIERQWKTLLSLCSETVKNAIVISDISESMRTGDRYTSPINISVGFGILLAEMNKSLFSRQLVILSKYPWTYNIPQDSLADKVRYLFKINHTMYNDVEATLDFVSFKLKNMYYSKNIPSFICIISDSDYKNVNFKKYQHLPRIVLWNVLSDAEPIVFERHLVRLSGSGLLPMKFLLNGVIFNPENIIEEIVKNPFI